MSVFYSRIYIDELKVEISLTKIQVRQILLHLKLFLRKLISCLKKDFTVLFELKTKTSIISNISYNEFQLIRNIVYRCQYSRDKKF